jgi:hypothetical protein
VTDRTATSKGVVNDLADLVDPKLSPADYAMAVRKLFDLLVEGIGDDEWVREFLLFQVSVQQHRGLVSKQHHRLVTKMLPKPPARKRGRPKDGFGRGAYDKRHKLYKDLTYESVIDPDLTKLQFAKRRLGVTDDQYVDSNPDRARVDALLQALKPARMKYLEEDKRRAIDIIFPLIISHPQHLALQWREAKKCSPALSQEEFLQEFFGWVKHFGRARTRSELHPIELEAIDEYVQKINEGEKLLAGTEGR